MLIECEIKFSSLSRHTDDDVIRKKMNKEVSSVKIAFCKVLLLS